eukprot:363221-Chlamydomonas_euryale.AAC.15
MHTAGWLANAEQMSVCRRCTACWRLLLLQRAHQQQDVDSLGLSTVTDGIQTVKAVLDAGACATQRARAVSLRCIPGLTLHVYADSLGFGSLPGLRHHLIKRPEPGDARQCKACKRVSAIGLRLDRRDGQIPAFEGRGDHTARRRRKSLGLLAGVCGPCKRREPTHSAGTSATQQLSWTHPKLPL